MRESVIFQFKQSYFPRLRLGKKICSRETEILLTPLIIFFNCFLTISLLPDSVAITIVIIETTTVAIPTTTDRHIRFLEDPRNVAWLTVSCAVFGGLGLFIIYLVARYGSIAQLKKWCQRPRYTNFFMISDFIYVHVLIVLYCGNVIIYSLNVV